MLKHIVLLRFRDTVDNDFIEALQDKFTQLRQQIPGILSFFFGENIKSKTAFDCTHLYMMDFVDNAYYENYKAHEGLTDIMSLIQTRLADENAIVEIDSPLEILV